MTTLSRIIYTLIAYGFLSFVIMKFTGDMYKGSKSAERSELVFGLFMITIVALGMLKITAAIWGWGL